MLCTHKTTILCQFGLFCHKLTTISPSILNHFWWELYHLPELEYDWTRIYYGNVLEEIPKDAPEPLGKSVTTTTFLDANLLHALITGRSVTAVFHFFNLTPGDWYSKTQATVENATYGSEFVAAKTATEQIVDIRQALRYLGVPIKSKALHVW